MTEKEAAALRQMLHQRNQTLIEDGAMLESSLSAATVPHLLEPYRRSLLGLCQRLIADCRQSIARLQLNVSSILEEILSDTKQSIFVLRLLNECLATPIVRSRWEDTLCLLVLTWVHGEHSLTRNLPVAFVDGGVAVRPMMGIAPIYYFPHREQQGLLFQALHFHEFGHGLYVLHRPEMDDLVKELQEEVERALAPRSGRNDPHGGALSEKQQAVINRWYSWAQEFFCDAVGLTIGGPAYLYAFSNYINQLSRSDFYLTDDDLGKREHPITRLRIHLLVRRANQLGLTEAATLVDAEWTMLAGAMQITEDYHGYYESTMEDEIYRIIGDMLIEASPRQFLTEEAAPQGEPAETDTPVRVLNAAWQVYQNEPNRYALWEKHFTAKYMTGPLVH